MSSISSLLFFIMKKIIALFKKQPKKKGFTLIEILLVVAAIAILSSIVIVAINPGRQLATVRDTERSAEANAILNGVSQYILDGNSVSLIPTGVCDPTGATTTQEVCLQDAASCTGLVDLESILVADYLAAIPADPTRADAEGSGYFISQNNGRVSVCADPETDGTTISVTR